MEEEIDPEMGRWAFVLLVRGFNGPPSSASEAAGMVVLSDWCGEVNPAAGPGGEDRRGSREGGGAGLEGRRWRSDVGLEGRWWRR